MTSIAGLVLLRVRDCTTFTPSADGWPRPEGGRRRGMKTASAWTHTKAVRHTHRSGKQVHTGDII